MCEREDRIADPTGILDPSAYASDSGCHAQKSSRVEVDPTGQAKVFIWRKVGPARRVPLPSKKSDSDRRDTLLAEQKFCPSCWRFAMFCKEMYKKLARPR